jgi:sugar phosphate isomerase/epimerase
MMGNDRGRTTEPSRREFLARGLAVASVVGVAGATSLDATVLAADEAKPYGPFKMGLQSYSLRGLTQGGEADRRKALAATRELGLHYWESYPAHVPMIANPEGVAMLRREIEANGVKVIGYGVVHFNKDADASRKYFEFAKAMGLEYISADPDPDSLDSLDKLVEEYGVGVGIHNHGPGHRYGPIDTIAKLIKDHSPKIGCCIDTGHFLRSKEDPVRAAEVFKSRIYGVHLKDVKDATTFTILGQGDLRTVDFLKALASQNYDKCLAIEYEEKPEDPIDDIKACLAEARKAIAKIGA